MRLICPNCGAQYDVPDEVMPAAGRDVQCSNCGHTWFQTHPDADAALAEDLSQPQPEPDWQPEPEPENLEEDEAAEDGALPPPVPPGAEVTRRIDPEMAEIFREEVEYENRRRSAEALESQPELGLTEPDEDAQARRARQARERMARMRGAETETGDAAAPAAPLPARAEGEAGPVSPEPAGGETPARPDPAEAKALAAAAAAGSRRDLLPDVDEINQSLRSSNGNGRVIDRAKDEAQRQEAEAAEPSGGGFGRGFLTMLVLVGAAVALYLYAPLLAETLPPLAPMLESYSATIDAARLWLDGQVTALLMTLDTMSSEARTPAPVDAPAQAPADPPAGE